MRKIKEEVNSTYSKTSILTSKKYRKYQDLLSALLKDNKEYSLNDVDELINKFMKGKVI